MKKIKYLALGAIFFTFLNGCLQVDTKVNLNSDGSGTIEETVVMKSEVINMMKEFAMAFDSTKSEEFNMFNEEELKNKASNYGEGVTYVSGEKIKMNNYEGFKVIYAFTDINKIKVNPSPEDKVPFDDGVEITENEEAVVDDLVKFNFVKGNPSTLVVIFPKPQPEKESVTEETNEFEDSTFNAQTEQKVTEMFDGMKMSLFLNFKDGIDETDASFVNGSEITLMQIDFSEIIKNKEVFKKFTNSKPETMEEFKEVIGDVEGIKLEFKDKITVKF